MSRWVTGKKVLVTGGAGFIGSNLVESLLSHGNHVVCLDNFSTGRRENVREFHDNLNFSLLEGDIRDLQTCMKACEGVELVFHQAALGSVPRSIKDPVTTTDVNIGGFVKMLFSAKEKGVKRFIYAASSSTYGDSVGLPKVENKIGKPLSPYGITKFTDELFAENFSVIYNIDVIGLRYFNVFGYKQDPEGAYAAVIPRFMSDLFSGKQPLINGDGSHSRDFTFIDNVVLANHLAATVCDDLALNQVYNVACGKQTTLARLFEIIRQYAANYDEAALGIEPVHGPDREGDIPHSLASIEKASTLLGYNPTVYPEDGLRLTVDWFWNNK
ncbi:MAG: SDR family oxidoreductase [Bacteroidales bacterium]